MNNALNPFSQMPKGKIVIFDLEYTCWEGSMARGWTGENEYCEIVQLGAVKLDGSKGHLETASYDALIKPKLNPNLSDYFTDLTGIHQAELDQNGISFPDAIHAFSTFIGDDTAQVYSCGGDEKHVYWNCGLHALSCPIDMRLFRDIMPILQMALSQGTKPITSSQLPQMLGLGISSQAHNALADARCIAEAIRVLRKPEMTILND
jgi:inhibitor of KinA sporulation pathway (predicted exonuclease)